MTHPQSIFGMTLGLAVIAWGLMSKVPYGTLAPSPRPHRVLTLRAAALFWGLFCIAFSWKGLHGSWGVGDLLGLVAGLLFAAGMWGFNWLMNNPQTGLYRRRDASQR